MRKTCCTIFVLVVALVPAASLWAERERFEAPKNGANLGVWRITNDPTVRDWANYHNTQCWSPDGRYLCYTRWGFSGDTYGGKTGIVVHVYDLHKDQDRALGIGMNPRWAKQHNWLFFARYTAQPGGGITDTSFSAVWLDVDSGKEVPLAPGVEVLGETDADDQWLIGCRRFRGQTPEFKTVRIPIKPDAKMEELPGVAGMQLLPNPPYPVFFTREDHKKEPFGATRWWFDLDGRNRRMAVPTVQQCHMSWLGNGEYFLLGNGLIRGRCWNEPFPSNVHFLASVTVGDVSPCGRSGRYATGDHTVADLRSGDGWHFISPLSIICYPAKVADDSGIYDADPKGSPDGTKVCFVSNYDLKDGPLTFIAKDGSPKDTVLHVQSTEGFPASGSVAVDREVIGYARKTATTFEGLSRQRHDTAPAALAADRPVTSFEARCLTDEQWKRLPGPSSAMRHSIDDPKSPLLRQRQTDVYVVVIRRPDRPCLRLAGVEAQLIPGEEHYETLGYHVLHGERRVTREPLRPGTSTELKEPGEYRAVAVEWCGLESEPSLPLRVPPAMKLAALPEPPKDFSWTRDRWLVKERETSPDEAKRAPEAVRETVHLHDGVIHREWHRQAAPGRRSPTDKGTPTDDKGKRPHPLEVFYPLEQPSLTQRHDLNKDGKAIRRLTYKDGKLALREYYNRDGQRVSQELFAADGYITESIRYQPVSEQSLEADHWWYDRGCPVRRSIKDREEYVKQGDTWVMTNSRGK